MVAIPALREPFDRHPLTREVLVALAAVGALGLWTDLVVEAVRRYVPLAAIDAPGGAHAGLALTSFLTGVFVIAGVMLFVGAFARLRDLDTTPAVPDRRVVGYGAGAVGTGVGLVVLVRVVAGLSGESLSVATTTTYGPGATVGVAALVTALGLFVGVPVYVVTAHVVVQRSVRRAGRPMAAVGFTALVVGTAGPTTVLRTSPVRATVGTALVVLAIALPVIAAETYDRRWLTALTTLPVLLLLAGLAVERLTPVPAATSVAFQASTVAVVAVGAYAYERSGSTLPSALAYASFVVATEALVFAAHAGVLA